MTDESDPSRHGITHLDQGCCALGRMLKARPQVRLTEPEKRSTKKITCIIGYLITYDIIGCPGQFLAQYFDSSYTIGIGPQ